MRDKYNAAYKVCMPLYDKHFKDLVTQDLQSVIDDSDKNYSTLKDVKSLFNQLFKYAIMNNLASVDYAKYVDIKKHKDKNPNKLERTAFSHDFIDYLWTNADDVYYQIILILVYTGLRISELLDLKKEDVHLEKQFIKVISSKTESGIRDVPISTYILPIIEEWYHRDTDCEYLVHTLEGRHFKYKNYADSYFKPILNSYGLNLTPHCTRHTFISLMATAKVSSTYQKLIAGHKGAMNITERVYTHIDMSELIKTVDSLYYPEHIKKLK